MIEIDTQWLLKIVISESEVNKKIFTVSLTLNQHMDVDQLFSKLKINFPKAIQAAEVICPFEEEINGKIYKGTMRVFPSNIERGSSIQSALNNTKLEFAFSTDEEISTEEKTKLAEKLIPEWARI